MPLYKIAIHASPGMQKKQMLIDPDLVAFVFSLFCSTSSRYTYFICRRLNWHQMDFSHVLADSFSLDWQMVDGLITRLKHFVSGIKGILSHLRLALSTQKASTLEAFEAGQNDQCKAVKYHCCY